MTTPKHFAQYDLLYNYKTGLTDTLYNAEHLDDESAFYYVPDTPRASRLYEQYRKDYTPYETLRIVNDIIFNGVRRGKTAHDTGD